MKLQSTKHLKYDIKPSGKIDSKHFGRKYSVHLQQLQANISLRIKQN
jgi:hypothetical protein